MVINTSGVHSASGYLPSIVTSQMSSGIRRFSSFSYCFLSINSIGLYLKYLYGKLAKCLLYKYSVRRRAYVLFTLFVFVCVQWRPTHIMWCFCFCIASFSGLSILIAPSVFSNVYFYYINLEIVRLYILSMNLHCNTNIVNKVVFQWVLIHNGQWGMK